MMSSSMVLGVGGNEKLGCLEFPSLMTQQNVTQQHIILCTQTHSTQML